jgi:hypothetical protein
MSGARHRRSPESVDHRAVVTHAQARAKSGVVWWHTPNGGRRDPKTGAQMRRLGTKAGVSDLLFFREGRCDCGARRLEGFALELKRPGGRLSEAQLEFLARFNDAGGHSAVAEGLDRALACLEAWGLLSGRSQ